MPLQGTVQKASPGLMVFDINAPLTTLDAKAFKEAGFDGVIRYAPRTSALMSGNATYEEASIILAVGLCLSIVQHCPMPNWLPTGILGAQYGTFAAQYTKNTIGLPGETTLWADLEAVSKSATEQDVIDYCTEWFNAVQSAGYIPGLYIGWRPGLNGQQLYDLPFKSYWRAYNADFTPLPRGYQLIQHTQKSLSGIAYDPNTTQLDELGDSFMWVAPA